MLSALISLINETAIILSNTAKKNFFNYNELETAKDEYTLVSRDGSLLSVIAIDGIREIISERNYYQRIIKKFEGALAGPLSKNGHVVQFVYQYDPTKSEILIDRMLKPAYDTCKRLNLSLEYMLDSKRETSKGMAAEEKNFLLIWTTSAILSKQEAKRSAEDRAKEFKANPIHVGNSGNPFAANEYISNTHDSVVSNIKNVLNQIGVVFEQLDVSTAVREIRLGIDEEHTGENWTPALPGDRVLPRQLKQTGVTEEYDVLPAKISQQVCNRHAYVEAENLVRIGQMYYAPIYVDRMPKNVEFFNKFFQSMLAYKMPYRILYTLSGNGLQAKSYQLMISQLLNITSENNKLFNRAMKNLKSYAQNGGSIAQFSIALCTWARKGDIALEQASRLAKTLESWGQMEISEITGNPISGLASASMGFTKKGIATVTAAPLVDALSMLPLSRPSSLWDSGAMIFSSPDGKLMPYQPISSLQETFIKLIYAPPGSGKSVLANLNNIALCLREGQQRLPFISIIDIGVSSKGFIEMMRDALPKDQKHLVAYSRIENTEKYAMNPMDLKLCCRFPIETERQYMINLIALLCIDTSSGTDSNGDSVAFVDFISLVIDKAFERFSDSPSFPRRQPKNYNPYIVPVVDNALAEIGFKPNIASSTDFNQDESPTTWYRVVDELFHHGKIEEASLAQRYAVPTLKDLSMIVTTDESIKSQWGDFVVQSTGEKIIDAFNRFIASAIRAYPLLSFETRYDLSLARIISLDLEAVVQSAASPQERRKNAIMYMYAMRLITGEFFIRKDNLDEMPFKKGALAPVYSPVEKILSYHSQRIDEIRIDAKSLYIDEFHRTEGSTIIRQQVAYYMRVGRKEHIEISLASQSLDDFDKIMVDLATIIYILSANKESVINDIVTRIGVNDEAEIDILRNHLRGPGPNGNVLLAKYVTKRGNVSQVSRNKVGPVELWALNTNAHDMRVRDIMFRKVGSDIGRKILSTAFPFGSAENEIKNKRKYMSDNEKRDVYEMLVDETIVNYGGRYGLSIARVN